MLFMGRKLKVLFEVKAKKPQVVYNRVMEYLKKAKYEILKADPPNKIVARAGSKFMTYVMGTARWEKALRTAYITIRKLPKLVEVEVLWEVSWLVTMVSLPRAARLEVSRFAKFIGARVRGYKRVPAI